jgi:hypothetical protein
MNVESGLRIDIEYEFRADPGPGITLDELMEVMRAKGMHILEANRAGNYLILGRGKDLGAVMGRP